MSESGTAQGCEFFAVAPSPETWSAGACFAAMLANTSTSPIQIAVDYGGTPLDVAAIAREPKGNGTFITYRPLPNGELAPKQMAILFLSNYNQDNSSEKDRVDCPPGVAVGLTVNHESIDTGRGKAFHITTTGPVSAFDIYPYGGEKGYISSATLLVPTSGWGKNYIATDGYAKAVAEEPVGKPFVQIVAAEDGTNVTVLPATAIPPGTDVAPAVAGVSMTYGLSRGELLQFAQATELAGSVISADKPISVWGGSSCMQIPVDKEACDTAHQELLPVQSLGSEYVAVPYRDRFSTVHESLAWNIVGAVDDTVLTYDPPLPNVPLSIESGQSLEFVAPAAFNVRSQDAKHPFYLAAHMTGAGSDDFTQFCNASVADRPEYSQCGDPETVSVVPPQQWLPSYVFLTDPTFKNTNLVFTRQASKDKTFKDVTLDCVGTLSGWQALGTSASYQFTRVDLTNAGAPQGNCDNGVHEAKSDAPFGLTVWGWDAYVSYAYPGGMGIQAINTVVVPAVK